MRRVGQRPPSEARSDDGEEPGGLCRSTWIPREFLCRSLESAKIDAFCPNALQQSRNSNELFGHHLAVRCASRPCKSGRQSMAGDQSCGVAAVQRNHKSGQFRQDARDPYHYGNLSACGWPMTFEPYLTFSEVRLKASKRDYRPSVPTGNGVYRSFSRGK